MTDAELTQAELFDVFSNARRRLAVAYLTRRSGESDLAPLVEYVAARENDVDPEAVTRTQRRRVYISLYQTHLPMLDDHGIVEWDPDEHAIELVPDASIFEPYLDRRDGTVDSWHYLYAPLSVAASIAFVVAWASIGPLSAAAAPFVALGLTASVVVVATVQYADRTGRVPVRNVLHRNS